jgi:phage-related protein
MVRIPGNDDEKPMFWMGSSKKDLKRFPEEVQDEIGTALSVAQFGETSPAAKPWKGTGPGTFEIVEDFNTDTYRAVYTVRFKGAVYVLHAFQKKSPKGKETAMIDVELIKKRLAEAQRHYQENVKDPRE